jgi:glyoxylase-like metal-dependent hydrolase (beta-lactamase superfamily II)/8-oxo-dGTP pyrophosphatase MutT (NUDIX family)
VSELPEGIPRAEPSAPHASALGIVVRRDGDGRWETLLGRRSPRSRFLAGHLAFPGGRLEDGDEGGLPGAARRCASREMAEESGVAIAPDRWLDAGERITPALYPVRFRARFFVTEAPAGLRLPDEPPQPEEIDALHFEPAGEVLAAWERGDLLVPPPVLAMLRAISGANANSVDALAGILREVNEREGSAPRIEFVPGVWMLPVRTDTLPPATHTNVWMPGGRSFVIVDPGSDDPEEIAGLLRVVARRRDEGAALEAVVLSHHHQDHASGAVTVAETLGVPLRAHRAVIDRLRLGSSGLSVEEVGDGEVMELGGITLEALHTPGHAPGHLAFLVREHPALIAGDLVSGLSTILIDPSDGDMGLYVESLERVAALGCRRVLPSHGPPLPGKVIQRAIEHRRMREDRILAALRGGPGEITAIARSAYHDVPEAPPSLAEQQTLANLRYLAKRGLVLRPAAGGSRWSLT